MAEIIVAVFDTVIQADLAEGDLQGEGIPRNMIRRYAPGDADAPATAGPAPPKPSEGFFSWLFGSSGTDYEAHADRTLFEGHIVAGRTIISVHIVDRIQGSEVMRILESHSPAEMEAQRTDEPLTNNDTVDANWIRRYVVEQPEANPTSIKPSRTDRAG